MSSKPKTNQTKKQKLTHASQLSFQLGALLKKNSFKLKNMQLRRKELVNVIW
jgi:hypothetical protein